MGKLNLTFILVGVVAFIGIMLLVMSPDYGFYNHFMIDNQKIVPDMYASYYQNLTSQQGDLDAFTKEYEEETVINMFAGTVTSIASGFVSLLTMGIGAIKLFGDTPNYIKSILNVMQSAIPLPPPVFWMITTITFIICLGLLIKAVRNQIDLP